jgi:hypothetical protein
MAEIPIPMPEATGFALQAKSKDASEVINKTKVY